MEVEERIRKILDKQKIEYEVIEHEPVYTSEEAAKVRGQPLKMGVKALILKTRENNFVLALVRGDKKADMKRIAELENTGKVWLASPEEVLEVAGCAVGAVSPFGQPKPLKAYMDRAILENDFVEFNIGKHTKSIKMRAKDLEKVVKPVLI